MIQRVAGSFRDPSGFVFFKDDEVFRSIDSECCSVLMELANEGRINDWVERQLIVGTEFIDGGELLSELQSELPETDHFLRHDKIPLVTFPYEWTVSMWLMLASTQSICKSSC